MIGRRYIGYRRKEIRGRQLNKQVEEVGRWMNGQVSKWVGGWVARQVGKLVGHVWVGWHLGGP